MVLASDPGSPGIAIIESPADAQVVHTFWCVGSVPFWHDTVRRDVPGDDGASQGTLIPPGLHRFIADSHDLADRAGSIIGLGVRRGPEVRLMNQGPSSRGASSTRAHRRSFLRVGVSRRLNERKCNAAHS